jgi:hypothetical protein
MVYPAADHPTGADTRPWFQIRAHLAYAVDAHPEAAAADPSYRNVGMFWFPVAHYGPDVTPQPWFREAD